MKTTTAPVLIPSSVPPRLLARLPTVPATKGPGRSTTYSLIADGSCPVRVRQRDTSSE